MNEIDSSTNSPEIDPEMYRMLHRIERLVQKFPQYRRRFSLIGFGGVEGPNDTADYRALLGELEQLEVTSESTPFMSETDQEIPAIEAQYRLEGQIIPALQKIQKTTNDALLIVADAQSTMTELNNVLSKLQEALHAFEGAMDDISALANHLNPQKIETQEKSALTMHDTLQDEMDQDVPTDGPDSAV